MQYVEIVIALVGGFALAWGADLLTGRRGLGITSLVSGTGMICGWFLAVRVFAVSTSAESAWLLWAFGGSLICLITFFLFRGKR